ncbi:MAG TPA: hypothetical protein VGL99_22035, partial [Chloroflexota bacterium]
MPVEQAADQSATGQAQSDEPPKAPKKQTVYDLWGPVKERPWRQLPRLVWASVKLLWSSSPRVFTVVALLQVLGGAAAGLQLILVRNLLEA